MATNSFELSKDKTINFVLFQAHWISFAHHHNSDHCTYNEFIHLAAIALLIRDR